THERDCGNCQPSFCFGLKADDKSRPEIWNRYKSEHVKVTLWHRVLSLQFKINSLHRQGHILPGLVCLKPPHQLHSLLHILKTEANVVRCNAPLVQFAAKCLVRLLRLQALE